MDRVRTFVVILSTTQRTVTQRAVQAMGTQFEKVSSSAARCGVCRESLQLKHQGWGNLSEAVGSRQSPDVEPEAEGGLFQEERTQSAGLSSKRIQGTLGTKIVWGGSWEKSQSLGRSQKTVVIKNSTLYWNSGFFELKFKEVSGSFHI